MSEVCSTAHVRLAPLYDVASILPDDEIDMQKLKLVTVWVVFARDLEDDFTANPIWAPYA